MQGMQHRVAQNVYSCQCYRCCCHHNCCLCFLAELWYLDSLWTGSQTKIPRLPLHCHNVRTWGFNGTTLPSSCTYRMGFGICYMALGKKLREIFTRACLRFVLFLPVCQIHKMQSVMSILVKFKCLIHRVIVQVRCIRWYHNKVVLIQRIRFCSQTKEDDWEHSSNPKCFTATLQASGISSTSYLGISNYRYSPALPIRHCGDGCWVQTLKGSRLDNNAWNIQRLQ